MTASSRAILSHLEVAFEKRRNPRRAAEMTAYMRGQFAFIGLGLPDLDRMYREAIRDLPEPSERDLIDFARACWRRPEREYLYAACRHLRRHASELGPGFLAVAEHLITTKSWWDTVDELAINVVGSLVRRNPELVERMDVWIESKNIWLVRTAILHQNRYKAATDADLLFRYCIRRAPDTEFFIRKAIGWALREFAKTDPDAVRRFVATNDAALSGLSKREALKHLR